MSRSFEDVIDEREEWEATLPPAAYRDRIRTELAAMQVGDPGRAELLTCLSSSTLAVTAESESLVREALADGGPTVIDSRVELLRVLLALGPGRDDEAAALTKELTRATARPDVVAGLHATLGEVLEMADRLKEAQRAYTVGLKHLDPAEDEPEIDEDLCLSGRYRVRRALGLGRDSYDALLEELSPQGAAAIRERTAAT